MEKNIYPTHIVLRREGRTSFEINSELIGGVLLRAYHKIPDATQTGLLRVINQQAVQQSCTVPDLLLDAMVNYWVSLYEKGKNTSDKSMAQSSRTFTWMVSPSSPKSWAA